MVQPFVTFPRFISRGSYGALKSEVVEAFLSKVAFLEKNDPLRENFQNFVPKGFTISRIHVLCANFVKFGRPAVGEIARCLPDKKNKISARSLALASAPIAPQNLPRSAANNVLRAPHISSKSVHFRRRYSRTREHRSNAQ